MVYDLHSTFSPVSYLLVVISTGYFMQDAGDILFSGYARESWEFLFHHVLVIWAFMYAVLTRHYVAGSVVALFVEVNSVFLHSRLMLKMSGVAKNSLLYTIIKFLNITTYISFRLGAQFYLTWYIVVNYSWLDHAGYFLVSMVLINIMMLIYFYRLLRTDFFSKHSQSNSGRKFVQD
ncbi:Calfacilitin [Bagarius yarrelli]|uniref:Calfacilitin n=1 Tax=Bagarius yarrelli TaxID=175774 RepID=A0A556TX35_BAGYA|nr:Calfacilitin [Bagarius yarrelli]